VLEDKIVQQAVRMILEPIWENDFVDESIGYRPGRGGRKASQELAEALHDGKHRWVVEADIRGFFEHLNHDWLEKMLERRIADRSLIRIIRKWLNAGVMEELNHWSPSTEGTPQGGIISPLLGNIYLHFVQDLWIKKVMARQSKGSVQFRRYACGWLHNPNYWRVRRVTNADIEGKAHTVTTLQFTHLMLAYGAYYKELWDALKAED
jgi:retron-type reverse transcriptase